MNVNWALIRLKGRMGFGTVLVTGSAGFIGSHLCEHFLKQKCFVIGVDNYSTGCRANTDFLRKLPQSDHFHFIEADICKSWRLWEEQLPAPFQNVTHVFHFASPASPPLYQELAFETLWANSVGLDEAIHFADRYRARVIYASTSEVYGDPAVSPQPENYWGYVNSYGPRSCYDEAKRFGEALLYTHNLKNKTRHGLVRIFNTYGPRMNPTDGRVIINFLVQALKGEALTVYGDGRQTRSFCFIHDLLRAVVAYAAGEFTEPVNLGNDREFSILELASAVKEIFPENQLSIEHRALPQDDPKQRCPDLSKAKSILSPWSPTVSLKEGLLEMKKWMINDGAAYGVKSAPTRG